MRFVLSNSYGTRNVGDEAILTVLVRELLDRDHVVDILTYTPAETAVRQPGASVVRSGVLRGAWATYEAIRTADVLVVGGGGIIQDSTSLGNLLFHVSRTWMARLAGTPFVLCGVGVGPLRRALSRKLVRAMCRHAQHISVRDQPSVDLLTEIGVAPCSIEQTADLAHLLLEAPARDEPTQATFESLRKIKRGGRRLIGISLRPPVGDARQRSTDSPQLAETVRAAATLSRKLIAEHAGHIVFISMHPDQDDAIGERLREELKDPHDLTVISGRLTPGEIKTIIGELDLLIGMRLHSLIFATSQRTVCIGLSYDRKISGYLESLGLEDQVVPSSPWRADDVLLLAVRALDRRAALEAAIDESLPALRARARESLSGLTGPP